ncbi:hypothetical protein P9112_009015 [Eukaryota sp. TZLM1-RC]
MNSQLSDRDTGYSASRIASNNSPGAPRFVLNHSTLSQNTLPTFTQRCLNQDVQCPVPHRYPVASTDRHEKSPQSLSTLSDSSVFNISAKSCFSSTIDDCSLAEELTNLSLTVDMVDYSPTQRGSLMVPLGNTRVRRSARLNPQYCISEVPRVSKNGALTINEADVKENLQV